MLSPVRLSKVSYMSNGGSVGFVSVNIVRYLGITEPCAGR
jgi:hypothetical protein